MFNQGNGVAEELLLRGAPVGGGAIVVLRDEASRLNDMREQGATGGKIAFERSDQVALDTRARDIELAIHLARRSAGAGEGGRQGREGGVVGRGWAQEDCGLAGEEDRAGKGGQHFAFESGADE